MSTRSAQTLTAIILPLVAVAAACGLFLPGLYRDTAWVVPQNQGFDLFTLLVIPVIGAALLGMRRGSVRANLVLIGLLGYVLYIYIGAAFAYAFNEFYLLYVALFTLSTAALVAAVSSVDVAALPGRFGAAVPRRSVSIYLVVMALILAALWLSHIIPFYSTGIVPESITLSGAPTSFIYALDLGAVVPLSLLGAYWLWRREPWGYLVAGSMLIKYATMGLALLAMSAFAAYTGMAVEMELVTAYTVIALGGVGFSFWFFKHCRG